jgi:hypothetical protein
LLREASRKPGKAPLAEAMVQRVVALTCVEPPDEATRWTGRAMANATCVSLRSVQRMWQVHRLQPHRIRTFKRSQDPAFAAKLEDIVGPTRIRPSMPLCFLSTKSHRSRRLIAPSGACRSSQARPGS